MKLKILPILMVITATLLLNPARAGAATKPELQKRFEQRYPGLLEYKTQGKIGETDAGLLESVDPKYLSDATLKQLVAEENTDRSELYQIIAREEKITPETVANRSALRNFERARSGEFLKRGGKWEKKS